MNCFFFKYKILKIIPVDKEPCLLSNYNAFKNKLELTLLVVSGNSMRPSYETQALMISAYKRIDQSVLLEIKRKRALIKKPKALR